MKLGGRASILFVSMLAGFFMVIPTAAFATNGMNLEGYGPIATGMGGASMAYDNGAAAMMNNPATLGLMPEGSRLDVALGYLGPHVKASCNAGPCAGLSSDSTGTSYYMPAFGWVTRSGKTSYGIGMFAQGGMGTQYEAESFLTLGSGEPVRSEVSVGRLLVPVAYDAGSNFKIGGSFDFVWAGMDIKMALPGDEFMNMASGTSLFGRAAGSMVNILGGAIMGGMINVPNWTRFDFSDRNDYTGEASGTGVAAKIGGTYTASDEVTLGFAYHSKTALSNLDTKKATLSMNVDGAAIPGGAAITIPVTGSIEIVKFEWPQMAGMGVSYRPTRELMLVADYKWINWKDVMKDFTMVFTADMVQGHPAASMFGLGGQMVVAKLYQNWKDQNVFMLGAAYALNDALTLRAGLNLANDPIPDFYVNALFPAIIKNHVTAGAGVAVSKESSVDLSFAYAPEVKVTTGQMMTVKHSQTNGQIMYSYRF